MLKTQIVRNNSSKFPNKFIKPRFNAQAINKINLNNKENDAGNSCNIKKENVFNNKTLCEASSLTHNTKTPLFKETTEQNFKCYTVLYCKKSRKKHKTWQDGILIVKRSRFVLKALDGKQICSSLPSSTILSQLLVGKDENEKTSVEGIELSICDKQIEIIKEFENKYYENGQIFVKGNLCFDNNTNTKTSPKRKFNNYLKKLGNCNSTFKKHCTSNSTKLSSVEAEKHKFKNRNDPNVKGSLILNSARYFDSKEDKCAVVVDNFLSVHLRPHQRDGVKFLYECLMGNKTFNYFGAILADEMGLGKTLQTITLIQTLLKDGPNGLSSIRNCLIIAPSTLTQNQANEFLKQLGSFRLNTLVIKSSDKNCNNKIRLFCKSSQYPILIASYEMFVRIRDQISEANVDLLVCDEGHRLKNSQGNITINFLRSLSCKRRLILTGTPIQNFLDELYAMCDFVNPGILGDLTTFRNVYAKSIEAGRDKTSSTQIFDLGNSRSKELSNITNSFILRRTKEVLKNSLPPKLEYIVFCRMTTNQIQCYKSVLQSFRQSAIDEVTGISSDALQSLNLLSKIALYPGLLSSKNVDEETDKNFNLNSLNFQRKTSQNISHKTVKEESHKFYCLLLLVREILKIKKQEKIVVVSNKCKALDVVTKLFESEDINYLRLDGSTPVNKRMDIVSRFNRSFCAKQIGNYNNIRVLLLSAKAGGVGINLVGASRLILLDPDQNPAIDLQVMGRIWRDGQKRKCTIYRLLSIESIEEKIFQRQLKKLELDSIVSCSNNQNKEKVLEKSSRHFSAKEIKQIFTFNDNTKYCNTYDVLNTESIRPYSVCTNPTQIEDDIMSDTMFKMGGDNLPIVFELKSNLSSISTINMQRDENHIDVNNDTNKKLENKHCADKKVNKCLTKENTCDAIDILKDKNDVTNILSTNDYNSIQNLDSFDFSIDKIENFDFD